MKRTTNLMLVASVAVLISACNSKPGQEKVQGSEVNHKNEASMKKFTKEDFYKDGEFDAEVAKEAYFELMRFYHVPVTPILKTEEFWVSDFAQKDFTTVGMGGIFWVNNVDHGYFGHDIYLLPGQMLVEHKHHKVGDVPAKMETWQVRHGSAYFFGEGDETKPMPVTIPQSQIDNGGANCRKATLLEEGGMLTLNRIGAWHYIIAGPQGAIISEYATPHHGDALEFANKTVVF
ncbi:MAG TPA: hypothetical protein VKA10_00475 [Prolixibacteraceae bacterium]|nr:hypothetical protein [Prolixibacteraceae bacterium]